MDVRKNRFDGDLGRFQIVFDQDMQLYRDEMSESGSLAAVTAPNEGRHAASGAPVARGSMDAEVSVTGASAESTACSQKHVVLDEIIMS